MHTSVEFNNYLVSAADYWFQRLFQKVNFIVPREHVFEINWYTVDIFTQNFQFCEPPREESCKIIKV